MIMYHLAVDVCEKTLLWLHTKKKSVITYKLLVAILNA